MCEQELAADDQQFITHGRHFTASERQVGLREWQARVRDQRLDMGDLWSAVRE